MAKPVILTTLNASYFHAAFGLRYLYANLQEYQDKAKIVEFTIAQNPRDIAEQILSEKPEIIGIGVYIWNTHQVEQLVSILKRIAPEVVVVLGGPEVSHELEGQKLCELADYVIRGEADHLFYQFCKGYFADGKFPFTRWVSGEIPDIKAIQFPYAYYTDEDVKNRVVYVEASRGCAYQCEFCLSSLDKSVRAFDLSLFLEEMGKLMARGVRQFKFVDRTFNLNIQTSKRILEFFLARIDLGLFLHFEVIPDRLPDELKSLIEKFPPGALQFEIGVQTWNPTVAALISRKQDFASVVNNFNFLREKTTVHIHADLIVGLPGEDLESFGKGFDQLAALNPHEIQVGILKRLKGTPIVRHDGEWKMVYQEHSPFSILSTKLLSYSDLQRMNRFAKFWDLIQNSGNFKKTMILFKSLEGSLFKNFFELSEFLTMRHPQNYGVALMNLVESLWLYLTIEKKFPVETIRPLLIQDYCVSGKRDVPKFLRTEPTQEVPVKTLRRETIPARQARHLS